MYLRAISASQGQGTSGPSGDRGAPTECMQGMNGPSPSTSSTLAPMRVMIFMLTTTEGLSVICTPILAMGEPSGPMLNGMTYMVRPRMQPSNNSSSVARIFAGGAQLLVGPASSWLNEQMKVRSSTRPTSDGCERVRKELGRLSGLRRMNVPDLTIIAHSRSYSRSEPSTHSTESGLHRRAISSTHADSCLLVIPGTVPAASNDSPPLRSVAPRTHHLQPRQRGR